MIVRAADRDDATAAAYIYNHYIATSHATFETEPIGGGEMLRRITDGRERGYPFLVAADGTDVVGYAYGREYRLRAAYRQSIEVSVYIRPGHDGYGIGSALYDKLLSEISKEDFHAVIAGVALPNDASVRLHEKLGFEKVAHFREVGRKFDRWIDVGYWELLIRK